MPTFAFAVSAMPEVKTRVIVDIRPLGSGCELVLTHEGVPPEYAERTSYAWATILDRLAAALQND